MATNTFGRISVAITASIGGLTAGLNAAASRLDGFSRRADALNRIGLATTFIAATQAAYLAARAFSSVTRAVYGMATAASDLVEEENRVDVIFGKSAQAVKNFAANASGVGVANVEGLRAAGTFGLLLKNIGLTEASSAQMSMQLVQLAADMASFNNVATDDALRALRSALVGEVEPIRRLGVQLNDASLRQKAFNMGLVTTVNQVLTPATKMQAAYAAIMEQTAVQQGDAVKTSGELAGQLRQLRSNFLNLITAMGKSFLNTFREIVSGLNSVMDNLRALFSVAVKTFGAMFSEMTANTTAAEVFAATIRNAAAAVVVMYGASKVLYAGITKLQSGFLYLGGYIYKFLESNSEFFATTVEKLEELNRFILELLISPFQSLLEAGATAADLLGVDGLGDSLRASAKRMRELVAASSGLPEFIRGAEGDAAVYGVLAEEAFRMGEEFGASAAETFAEGMQSIQSPFQLFDEELLSAQAASAAAAMLPAFGDLGQQLGKGAGEEIAASTKQLSAIVVDSSAGEAFRNAILRGADPRLAQNADQKIIDNTGRAADGIAALPGDLGAVIGAQFAAASVSV